MSNERREPSEKIRLRNEARYLKKRIKQAQSLLAQREQVKSLTLKLTELEQQLKYER